MRRTGGNQGRLKIHVLFKTLDHKGIMRIWKIVIDIWNQGGKKGGGIVNFLNAFKLSFKVQPIAPCTYELFEIIFVGLAFFEKQTSEQ